MLIKQGFKGRILTTRLTAQLLEIMLLVFPQVHGHEGGAQQVPRVGKLDVHALAEVDELAILADNPTW